LAAAAGKPAAEASPTERLTAYARVAIQSSTRAELLFMLEGSTTPDHAAPWDEVMDRWVPPPATDPDDPAALDRFIARLAADGLWLYDSLTTERLSPKLRRAVADRITAGLTQADS
jgi:hypothetical protein